MATFINRIIGFGDSSMASRSPLTDEPISSPLRVYGQLKKQINKIQHYLAGAYGRMIGRDVINGRNELISILDYRSEVKGIDEVLARDHKKVDFVGRMITGKSTVVNFMLGEKVLSSDTGHTSCKVVEGSQTPPLRDFGQTKKQINKIVNDIQEEYERMIDIHKLCPDMFNKKELQSILDYNSKLKLICAALTCDDYIMKVAFFYLKEVKHVIKEMIKIMEIIDNQIKVQINLKMYKIKRWPKIIKVIEQQFRNIKNQINMKIHQIGDYMEAKLYKALNDEIHRLPDLVEEFNLPFQPEALVLNVYKKELHKHVEASLVKNLQARLSTALVSDIDQCQIEVIYTMFTLLPKDRYIHGKHLKRVQFKDLHGLHLHNLCGDFREQLEFKFPWGLSKLVTCVSSLVNWSHNLSRVLISPLYNPSTSTGNGLFSVLRKVQNLSLIYGAGFMLKKIGWRLIIATCVIYELLYLYKRLSWTTKKKEQEFKKQYVDHASAKLRLMFDLTSCSHLVQRELSNIYAQLVEGSITDLKEEVKKLDRELNMLTKSTETAKIVRNKADLLEVELKQLEAFLRIESEGDR